jgi:hypothetical protein
MVRVPCAVSRDGGRQREVQLMLHRTVVAFMATGILLAGCSSSADQSAGASAEQLLSSAAQGDGTRACEVLSPSTRSELEQSSGKPCAQAILEEDLPSGGLEKVEVFETMAIVHIGTQTVFLSRFDSRWLVIAAACTAVAGRPYDCAIQGA